MIDIQENLQMEKEVEQEHKSKKSTQIKYKS